MIDAHRIDRNPLRTFAAALRQPTHHDRIGVLERRIGDAFEGDASGGVSWATYAPLRDGVARGIEQWPPLEIIASDTAQIVAQSDHLLGRHLRDHATGADSAGEQHVIAMTEERRGLGVAVSDPTAITSCRTVHMHASAPRAPKTEVRRR